MVNKELELLRIIYAQDGIYGFGILRNDQIIIISIKYYACNMHIDKSYSKYIMYALTFYAEFNCIHNKVSYFKTLKHN